MCQILPTEQSCNMFLKSSCVFSFLCITIHSKVFGPKLDTVLLLKPQFLLSAAAPVQTNLQKIRFQQGSVTGIIAEQLGKVPAGTATFLCHNFTLLQTVLYYTASSKDKTFRVSKCCFIEMVGIFKIEVSPGKLPAHTNV